MNSDPLKSALQREAGESAPGFSPLVHERVMASLRAADAHAAIPVPRSYRWHWVSAAVAAVLVAAACIAFHTLGNGAAPVTPHPAPVAHLPSPSDFTTPVGNILAQAALPAEQTFDQGKYAYLDQDAKRFAVFLADQIPSAPAGMNRLPAPNP